MTVTPAPFWRTAARCAMLSPGRHAELNNRYCYERDRNLQEARDRIELLKALQRSVVDFQRDNKRRKDQEREDLLIAVRHSRQEMNRSHQATRERKEYAKALRRSTVTFQRDNKRREDQDRQDLQRSIAASILDQQVTWRELPEEIKDMIACEMAKSKPEDSPVYPGRAPQQRGDGRPSNASAVIRPEVLWWSALSN